MAIRSVIKNVSGSSLVELMIATLMGGMALVIVGGVFISNQRSAAEKAKEIMLLQNLTSVMQQLKEDVQRAGFDDDVAKSVMFSDSTEVIHIGGHNTILGYVYRVASRSSSEYLHVFYKYDSQTSRLMLCEKRNITPLSVVVATTSGVKGNCYSLFDPHQIYVTDFSVHRNLLENQSKSALLTVRLSAALTRDISIRQSLEIKVKQRNWQ
ncbi:pilus assembly protein PilW [Vibrio diazotrophicus]|uniref:pilus assembly protein PilW n=1 Tax=Vibrio diazotrophicus TaxID=685 RepID=UPI000C9E8AA9|nr:pilus assembly protein PilW [Vibrio diazotrophicus]PNH81005.1 pilus assembly protein PilW [Vibrio diazotrophicus]